MSKRKNNKRIDKSKNNEILINRNQIDKLVKEINNIHADQNKSIKKIIEDFENKQLESDSIRDGYSIIVKILLIALFEIVGVLSVCSTIIIWNDFWGENIINNISIILVLGLSFLLIILGLHIVKIKSRSYLLSVFATLVALISLLVSLLNK